MTCSQENPPINDDLPGENLCEVQEINAPSPWYADVVNYLMCGVLPTELSYS